MNERNVMTFHTLNSKIHLLKVYQCWMVDGFLPKERERKKGREREERKREKISGSNSVHFEDSFSSYERHNPTHWLRHKISSILLLGRTFLFLLLLLSLSLSERVDFFLVEKERREKERENLLIPHGVMMSIKVNGGREEWGGILFTSCNFCTLWKEFFRP